MSVEKVATLELLPRCRARIPALGAVPRRGGIAFARAGRDAAALCAEARWACSQATMWLSQRVSCPWRQKAHAHRHHLPTSLSKSSSSFVLLVVSPSSSSSSALASAVVFFRHGSARLGTWQRLRTAGGRACRRAGRAHPPTDPPTHTEDGRRQRRRRCLRQAACQAFCHSFAKDLPRLCQCLLPSRVVPSLCRAFAKPLPSLCQAFAKPLPSVCR